MLTRQYLLYLLKPNFCIVKLCLHIYIMFLIFVQYIGFGYFWIRPLRLYSPVCKQPGRKPQKQVFSRCDYFIIKTFDVERTEFIHRLCISSFMTRVRCPRRRQLVIIRSRARIITIKRLCNIHVAIIL